MRPATWVPVGTSTRAMRTRKVFLLVLSTDINGAGVPDPSASVTVPLPDQFPAKPAKGALWPKLADAERVRPAIRPAAIVDFRTSLGANSSIFGFHKKVLGP